MEYTPTLSADKKSFNCTDIVAHQFFNVKCFFVIYAKTRQSVVKSANFFTFYGESILLFAVRTVIRCVDYTKPRIVLADQLIMHRASDRPFEPFLILRLFFFHNIKLLS